MPVDETGQKLVILVDLNVFHELLLQHLREQNNDPLSSEDFLKQLLVFVNSFMLLNERNRVVVLAVYNKGCSILHTSAHDMDQVDIPVQEIHTKLVSLMEEQLLSASAQNSTSSTCLSAGLSRALCYLNRFSQSHQGSRGHGRSRILCVFGSPDAPRQYIPVMNAIFSAQRADVVIDAVVLTDADSAYLQQAAFISGGTYLKPTVRSALLQYFLTVFSADSHCRSSLNLPKPLSVDFRASCFCHKKQIDIGYVCSVCLSIFCQKLGECSTCGTQYPLKKKKVT